MVKYLLLHNYLDPHGQRSLPVSARRAREDRITTDYMVGMESDYLTSHHFID